MPVLMRSMLSHSRALSRLRQAAMADLSHQGGLVYLGHHWRPLSNARGARLQVCLLAPRAPSSSSSSCPSLSGTDRIVLNRRHLHLSSRLLAPSSKIEETVERLKKKKEQEGEQKILEKMDDYTRVKSLQSEVRSVIDEDKKESLRRARESQVDVPKRSLWIRFVDEVKHYYSGFKLLFLDVRICSKIIWKVCKGNTLTRRENKQLVRTVSDLFRLVPFSVFVIVPFMELLLPVALKLFPGMLPSTFTTSSERENKMRRTLKAKLQYAKFLQQTLDEMAPKSDSGSRTSQSARDFVKFYQKVKEDGISVTNEDIVRFSHLFEDEITLDNMARSQLIALCRLLEINPIGTSNFLRFQLEMRVRQLKIDDKVIQKEGTDNLDVTELQAACKERGMRAYGLTEHALKQQLDQWLDLSLNHNIPPSLLLLSRTLFLPATVDVTKQIAATISALPESAATKTTAQIGEREGKVRNVDQLEVIKEEQRKIEEEEKERQETEHIIDITAEEAAERIKEVEALQAKAKLEEEAQELKTHVHEARGQVKKATVSTSGDLQEELVHEAAMVKEEVEVLQEKDQVKEASPEAAAKKDAEEISASDLTIIKSAIDSLSKPEEAEKDDIVELKKELQDYEEDLEDLKWMKAEAGRFDLHESKGAKRLFSRVNKMLGRMDGLVDSLQKKEKAITQKLHDEHTSEEEKAKVEKNLVTVHELIFAVSKLQDAPDSAKVEHIAAVLGRMDADADGVIRVDQVMRVIELLGKQHVEMAPKQINEIVDMLQKEEMMEIESHLEKVLVKETGESGGGTKKGQLKRKTAEEANSKQDQGDEELLRDGAKDLTEQEPEEHIKEMFAQSTDAAEEEPLQQQQQQQQQQVGMKASDGAVEEVEVGRGTNDAGKRVGMRTSSEKPPINLK